MQSGECKASRLYLYMEVRICCTKPKKISYVEEIKIRTLRRKTLKLYAVVIRLDLFSMARYIDGEM